MKIEELFEEDNEWTSEKVKNWCKEHFDGAFGFPPLLTRDIKFQEGKVVIAHDFALDLKKTIEIPFPILRAEMQCGLYLPMSLKNAPEEVGSKFIVTGKNIDPVGFPKKVKSLYLDTDDLTGWYKHIKVIENGKITIGGLASKGILGLLKVPGIKEFLTSTSICEAEGNPEASNELKQAVIIMNQSLRSGHSNPVIRAQREMIEADLDDFAEL